MLRKQDPYLYKVIKDLFPCDNTYYERCKSNKDGELNQVLKSAPSCLSEANVVKATTAITTASTQSTTTTKSTTTRTTKPSTMRTTTTTTSTTTTTTNESLKLANLKSAT